MQGYNEVTNKEENKNKKKEVRTAENVKLFS